MIPAGTDDLGAAGLASGLGSAGRPGLVGMPGPNVGDAWEVPPTLEVFLLAIAAHEKGLFAAVNRSYVLCIVGL